MNQHDIHIGAESFAIRRTESDAEIRAAAEIMASTDPWIRYGRTVQDNITTLNLGEGYTAIAPQTGAVAGVALVAMNVPLIRGYVAALAVAEPYRNRGLGTRLLEHAERRIFRESPNVFLCVTAFNANARRLYERLGYTQIGEIESYVLPGVSEFLMRKTRGAWSTFKPEQ